MTVSEIKKKIDEVYDNLSPEELGKYVSKEFWSIADSMARGEDASHQQKDLETVIDKYVYPLNEWGFIKYLRSVCEADEKEWGRRSFNTYLEGLVRQDALISLLLIQFDTSWRYEIILRGKDLSGLMDDAEWIEHREHTKKMIKELRERKREIAEEIQDILSSEFWDIRGIPRPDVPDIDPEEHQTILESRRLADREFAVKSEKDIENEKRRADTRVSKNYTKAMAKGRFEAAVRAESERSKLLGLNVSTKTEHAGKDGGPIRPEVTVADLLGTEVYYELEKKVREALAKKYAKERAKEKDLSDLGGGLK